MIKLFVSYSLSVRREVFRKVKEVVKKGNLLKMGFIMMVKLFLVIFIWEELVFSRGQGLKFKEGDIRLVLDVFKMIILKGIDISSIIQ